ncbi:MAG: FIST C-terminal domain-containing protein [Acidimicrobiia bacterium]|nr:FIST C-terminal domain-containing protein [Acidimicrobiia bacterium]
MRAEATTWFPGQGWTAPGLPDLDSESSLVVAFGDARLRDFREPLDELRDAYPRSAVLGCSTAGQIAGDTLSDGTVSVAVARFDDVGVRVATAPVEDSNASAVAGRRLAVALEDSDLRHVLVLSDGVVVNGSELVRGMTEHLPEGVAVTGGLAGDGDRFSRTWVLSDDGPRGQQVRAVGLYGDALRVGYGSLGGWDIFGPERLITRSDGNMLYEIDGKPALSLYKDYLGDRAEGLPATALLFPLAIRPARGGDQVVRTVLGVDEEHDAMRFAGDVPEGWTAQLMRANFDRLVDGASHAAANAATMSDGAVDLTGSDIVGDTLAIAISCVGRRLVLGERTEEELEATLEMLPDGVTLAGFYSYGEIAPHAAGTCDLHNQTMTITTIGEV